MAFSPTSNELSVFSQFADYKQNGKRVESIHSATKSAAPQLPVVSPSREIFIDSPPPLQMKQKVGKLSSKSDLEVSHHFSNVMLSEAKEPTRSTGFPHFPAAVTAATHLVPLQ